MEAYIKQQLYRKNRLIYFKSGRWAIHLLLFLFIYSVAAMDESMPALSIKTICFFIYNYGIFLSFYLVYCRYLIPGYFKQGRYLHFWVILTLSVISLPVIDLFLHNITQPIVPQSFSSYEPLTLAVYLEQMKQGLIAFIILSFILYMMEVTESIKTYRSISSETALHLSTEQQLIRTRMNPEFVMRSLEGIADLAEKHKSSAPDAVINFSDLLRYRLYHKNDTGSVGEELQHLEDLFSFHKAILPDSVICQLATTGNFEQLQIQPLILINIAEALFNTYDGTPGWSLRLAIQAKEEELQLTAEIHTIHTETERILGSIKTSIDKLLDYDRNFTTVQEQHNYRINICIPTNN